MVESILPMCLPGLESRTMLSGQLRSKEATRNTKGTNGLAHHYALANFSFSAPRYVVYRTVTASPSFYAMGTFQAQGILPGIIALQGTWDPHLNSHVSVTSPNQEEDLAHTGVWGSGELAKLVSTQQLAAIVVREDEMPINWIIIHFRLWCEWQGPKQP